MNESGAPVDQATPDLPPAHLVTRPDEVRASLNRFNEQAAANSEEAYTRVAATTYWVWDPDSGLFGPSKFCGFANMTFDRYLDPHSSGSSSSRYFFASLET